MFKLIRTNRKTVVAGLSIVAMVTFLTSFKTPQVNGTGTDRQVGTVNGKPLFGSEAAEAHAEVLALKNNIDFSRQPIDMQGQLRSPEARELYQLLQLIIRGKPEEFLLLRHEAIAAGIQIDPTEFETTFATYTRPMDPESDGYQATRNAIEALLKIKARAAQVTSAVKVSKPAADLLMARYAQVLQLDVMQLNSSNYLAKVPAPTAADLDQQFTKFAGEVPHRPTPTTNPFGFGYRLPVRARVQYIRVPNAEITKTIIASKTAYDWEVEARKYYLANPGEFPYELSAAATNPATLPTGPQPFEAVRDKILTDLRKPLISALADQIESYLNTTLKTDWQAYTKYAAAPNGAEPISLAGVPYSSATYLPKLVEVVGNKFHVMIYASETPAELSEDQIAGIPDVGTTALAKSAITQANQYLDLVQKEDTSAASVLMQPSIPLRGADDLSSTFFRLSEAHPSEPAPSLASIKPQVEKDLQMAAAYQLALAQAKDIVAGIKDHPLVLVSDTKSPLIHIKALSMQSDEIPEIAPPLAEATGIFVKQGMELLSTFDPVTNHNPARVIELHEQGRVFVAQLATLSTRWSPENYFYESMIVRQQRLQQMQMPLLMDWFNYDAVLKRNDFKPAGKSNG